jgi:hypothetical protein
LATSLALNLGRADSVHEGTNKINPICLSPQVKYCRSTVDEQCGIMFSCVAQSQAIYQSRLNNDDSPVPLKKIHFYDDKEYCCPPHKNMSGARRKKKNSFTPSSNKCVAVAAFVKSTSSYVAPSAKKGATPDVIVKSNSLFAFSGTAGCKCTGFQYLKADVVYTLECYHCEGSFKSDPHCMSAYFVDLVSCHELCGSNICSNCHSNTIVGED